MIRAIVWKEIREQGLIALTLLVLGAGILVAASTFAEPPNLTVPPTDVIRYLGLGKLATLLLAVTAGMVCGGALFAAEREAGTLGFLESLPASRGRLWIAKVLAGLSLAFAQIAVILLVAAGLGLVVNLDTAIAVTAYSLLAFAWGGFGSTLARTTLGSVGFAIPCASLAMLIFLLPIMLVFSRPGAGTPTSNGAYIFLLLMLLSPLALSRLVFTRPDRDRAADDTARAEWSARTSAPVTIHRSRLGYRALVWLSIRQIGLPMLVATGFALVFGLTLLMPTVQPFLVWPMVGLAAGVIAGVTTFTDEQGNRAAQFWSERRLPTGRLWTVKVFAHGLFALWLALVLLGPSAIRAASEQGLTFARGQRFLSAVMGTLLFDELGGQGWKYVLVPVGYGFVAGHLCGLLFRKAVVAAGVAGLVGGTATGLWIPSMMAGGLSHWQVWLPAVAGLGLARVLIRPWAADRLTARGPLTTFAVGGAFVVFSLAACIGYRVVEVPNNPAGEEDLAYVESLPPFDANEAGRNFRMAAERFVRFHTTVSPRFERIATPPGTNRFEERLYQSIHDTGWPGDRRPTADADLGDWLDALYTDRSTGPGDVAWFALAEESAGRPLGMYEDPRNYSPSSNVSFDYARRMANALLGRGLHLQARNGDHMAFVAQFRTVMALVRNLRNRSMIPAAHTANGIERTAITAAYQWLRNLPVDALDKAILSRVLEQMLTLTHEVDPYAPFDPTPHLLAERYVIRTLMLAPNQWLPEAITLPGREKESVDAEADLVSFAWTVPWERERTRRLVGLVFDRQYQIGTYAMVRGRPGAGLLVVRGVAANDLIDSDRALRAIRRAINVMAALRLYQLHRGYPPTRLEELVKVGILPAVPPDPFDDQPFRFRLSPGEELRQPSRSPMGQSKPPDGFTVAPGQAVLWSVGPDKSDGGGRQLPMFPTNYPRQEDWVFVVPLPKVH